MARGKSRNISIGIDCGIKGAITIFVEDEVPIILDMPLTTSQVRRKNKKGVSVLRLRSSYDLGEIIKSLKPYARDQVVCAIEKQSVRPGEGAVSAMTIGKGYGSLIGIASALEFDVRIVTPQSWKKSYPGLGKAAIKEHIDKKAKEKGTCSQNVNDNLTPAQIKAKAKTAARELAAKLYPKLSEMFKLVKHDGRAESLLIALYAKGLDS